MGDLLNEGVLPFSSNIAVGNEFFGKKLEVGSALLCSGKDKAVIAFIERGEVCSPNAFNKPLVDVLEGSSNADINDLDISCALNTSFVQSDCVNFSKHTSMDRNNFAEEGEVLASELFSFSTKEPLSFSDGDLSDKELGFQTITRKKKKYTKRNFTFKPRTTRSQVSTSSFND